LSSSAQAGLLAEIDWFGTTMLAVEARRGSPIWTTSNWRRTEHRSGPFDRAIYCLRHRVEDLSARCRQYRGLATRYDKRAICYQALWTIAMTVLWIREAR
jgi:transposase